MRFLLFFLLLATTPISAVAGDIKTVAELITPALATAKTDFSRALLLRDQIHRSGLDMRSEIPVATTEELSEPTRAYRLSFLENVRANACGGKAILYIAALREYGIDARVIHLYSNKSVGTIVQSHASVDVKIGDTWIAMDPTFNVSLKSGDGTLLSWVEAVDHLRGGKKVFLRSNGKKVLPHRSFEVTQANSGHSLEYLARYALAGPWRGGKAKNLTPDWDGKIEYLTGDTFDAWGSISSQFYQALAAPVAASGHARTSPVQR